MILQNDNLFSNREKSNKVVIKYTNESGYMSFIERNINKDQWEEIKRIINE